MTLFELCKELRNFFDRDAGFMYGTFRVQNGVIQDSLSGLLQRGQYFRICGSVFNDDVYQYPDYELTDEEFTGYIRAMIVPKDIIALLADINAWEEKYADTANSPYVSESFGGYSYTKKSNSTGDIADWRTVFASRLNRWRKI